MAYTRKARRSHKAGSRRLRRGGMTQTRRRGGRRHHRKRGGTLGAVMSHLSTPAVLVAANHMYGKKSRSHHKRSHRRYR